MLCVRLRQRYSGAQICFRRRLAHPSDCPAGCPLLPACSQLAPCRPLLVVSLPVVSLPDWCRLRLQRRLPPTQTDYAYAPRRLLLCSASSAPR